VILVLLLAFVSTNVTSQYRDSFANRGKNKKYKKNNKKGLFDFSFTDKSKVKNKGKGDPFSKSHSEKVIIGLYSDPFSSSGRRKYKPTGVNKDSFNYKQTRRAHRLKYDRKKFNKQVVKSRSNYFKIHYKY
jgi:hypothetical protein